MGGYSIIVLVCSAALTHSACQPKTASDVIRGPRADNLVMCGLNAQTMLARTDLVDGARDYMKVVCAPTENATQWRAELEMRKAALR